MRLPGFVNAHVHLELPSGGGPMRAGLPAWVRALKADSSPSYAAALANIGAVRALGTAAVVDIGNTDAGARALAPRVGEGFWGLALRELLGIDRDILPEAPAPYTPHSPYASHPDAIVACAERARAENRPWSIHCDEDPAERQFLLDGAGPWRESALAWGRDLSRFEPPKLTPVAYLDRLGVLGPHALLVHCTLTEGRDLDLIAETGATVVLCPRSNLYITGRLPDVRGMIARGIPFCIGTDSLSSTPDFDLLLEGAALARAFPNVDPVIWLRAITDVPRALPGMERVSSRPIEVDCPGLDRLFEGTIWPRRWACEAS